MRVQVIPGAGHLLPDKHPKAVAEAARQFFYTYA
jgi:hypothetical protein